MVIIFDLDDTIYNEKLYVLSGFKLVSHYLKKNFNIDQKQSFLFLKKYFSENGRNKIFNNILSRYNILNEVNLKKLISQYRRHKPNIYLPKESSRVLERLSKKNNLYLVTDGNKIVQKNKIEALKIKKYFKKILITHQYGLKFAKPSLYCFKLIKKYEKCLWVDLIYIADDPTKDFINLNKKGSITVRIKKGRFADKKVIKKFDAKYSIDHLIELFKLNLTN